MSSKPNILLLVIDCLRADYVYEDGLAYVPAIRALMDRGFSFANAIASTTTTTPSFASLLTGRYPIEHGVRTHDGGKLSPSVRRLPQMVKTVGYHTYAEACGPLGPEAGLDRGFDEYVHRGRREVITSAWGETLRQKVATGHYESPWFLMLHIWALHVPRQIVAARRDPRYGRTDYGRALSSIDLKLAAVLDLLPPDTLVVLTADHGEEIATGPIDHRIRHIRKETFKFLRKHGLTRKHVSIGYRDCSEGHGFAIYDYLVKVPLVLAYPAAVPAGRSDVQVRQIDVAPTILELAGVPVPGEMTGRGLMGVISGADTAHRDAYMEAVGSTMPEDNSCLAGIRVDNKYKYIYAPFYERFKPELYDLATDPNERRNIAEARPDLAADLRSRIKLIHDRSRTAGVPLTEDEQRIVMGRLKDLGYLDE